MQNEPNSFNQYLECRSITRGMDSLFTWGQSVGALVCRLLIVGLFAGVIHAQTPISIGELVRGFYSRYKNEQVAAQGWVSAGKRVSSTTFKAYYLKDRYSSTIVVRTINKVPQINSELLVTGVALVDADSKRFFISETKRKQVGSAREETEEAARQPLELPSTENLILIGLIAIGLLWAVMRLRRRKAAPAASAPGPSPSYKPAPAPVPSHKSGPAPEPGRPYKPAPPPIPSAGSATVASPTSQVASPTAPVASSTAKVASSSVDDFKTVRVFKTTKVLPGTLVVLENGQETDTIHLSDQSGRYEIEIGRDSPDIAGGIRIKDETNTLSRNQARLFYSNSDKQFMLVNLASETSNPTMINGRQMSGDETVVLKDNDVLRMGNVELRFRKS